MSPQSPKSRYFRLTYGPSTIPIVKRKNTTKYRRFDENLFLPCISVFLSYNRLTNPSLYGPKLRVGTVVLPLLTG